MKTREAVVALLVRAIFFFADIGLTDHGNHPGAGRFCFQSEQGGFVKRNLLIRVYNKKSM